MKKTLLSLLAFAFLSLLTSCSERYLMTTFYFKAPKLDIRKTSDFKALNPMQQDVELLVALIKDAYPMWEQKIAPTELEAERQRLLQLFATETNADVMEIEAQRLLARLQNAHTSISRFSLASKFYFPFQRFQVRDSFYIGNIGQVAKADSAAILGSLIERINGFSRSEINAKIRAFENGEDLYSALLRGDISNPKYLKASGLATQADSIRLTLKTPNSDLRDVVLRAVAFKDFNYFKINRPKSPYKIRSENYNYLIDKKNDLAYLNVGTMLDFVCYSDGFKQHVKNPLLRPLAKAWMKKRAKKSGNLNFKNFVLEAINAANTEGVKNLVIDLRANSGGDMRVPEQLFYLLDYDVKKLYHWYAHLSQYYKENLVDDAKEDAAKYLKATGKPLVFDGSLVNIDSIATAKTGYDFYSNVKNPKSAFHIEPNAPRFKGKVYFLTGLRTGSAAAITATLLKDNGLATIVGTPTGEKSTTQTGASGFKLPNSKVVGGMSYLYVERPNTAQNDEKALTPDVEIWQNLSDWYRGVDSQMAWIIQDIVAQKKGQK